MSFLYQDFDKCFDEQDRPALAGGHTSPISDAERYEWIRSHRGDFAINRALECSDFDCDFDRQIDTAIRASRAGLSTFLEASWWNTPGHPHRRRDDE